MEGNIVTAALLLGGLIGVPLAAIADALRNRNKSYVLKRDVQNNATERIRRI